MEEEVDLPLRSTRDIRYTQSRNEDGLGARRDENSIGNEQDPCEGL